MWDQSVVYTRVKFCWFEYPEAAYEVCHLGIDMLGLHLFADDDISKKTEQFLLMLDVLPPSVECVLLTDLGIPMLANILSTLKITSVQLYPDWSLEQIKQLRNQVKLPLRILKVMSAIPMENYTPDSARFLSYYRDSVDAILLDSQRCGGTGELADLAHCKKIIEASERPVLLAGGLRPENVGEIIRNLKPFGVDVESGISSRFHSEFMLKDIRKCQAFMDEVLKTDRNLMQEQASGRPNRRVAQKNRQIPLTPVLRC